MPPVARKGSLKRFAYLTFCNQLSASLSDTITCDLAILTVSCTSFAVATSTAMENVGASYPDQRSVVLLNFGERGRYIEAPGDNPAPSSVAN